MALELGQSRLINIKIYIKKSAVILFLELEHLRNQIQLSDFSVSAVLEHRVPIKNTNDLKEFSSFSELFQSES
jgi:hypothetical protein